MESELWHGHLVQLIKVSVTRNVIKRNQGVHQNIEFAKFSADEIRAHFIKMSRHGN